MYFQTDTALDRTWNILLYDFVAGERTCLDLMQASGNLDKPATFRKSGDFVFQVAVSFVLPGSPEIRTEPLKMEYVITIPEVP